MVQIKVVKTSIPNIYSVIAIKGSKAEVWNRGTTKEKAVKLAKVIRSQVYPR